MKRRSLALFLLPCLLLSAHGNEKTLQARFELARKIDGNFAVGQRRRLMVPGDVFGQSRTFPNDLRIFADDGTQWPFFLHIPQETVVAATLVPDILNPSFVSGTEPFLQFDLVVPPVDGKAPVHNQLELTTSGRDFVRRVEIYTEAPDRGLMATGYLIDFSRQRNARNQTIRYPSSDAARLHVRIYSNAQSANESFNLNGATLHYRAVKTVEREAVAFQSLEVPEREQEKNAQTHLLDLGEINRPVEFITFEVSAESYARCVSIYGRNTDHEPWQWVGGGEIHALTGDAEDTIKLNAKNRYLKVHVFHYDDQPLAIEAINLAAIPRYLVFEAATDGRAELYFKAWDIKAPRYDLKGRVNKETAAELPLFQTLETEPNPLARARPWRNYSKWLGGLTVGAVSLLVIWIIASMLKQQKTGME